VVRTGRGHHAPPFPPGTQISFSHEASHSFAATGASLIVELGVPAGTPVSLLRSDTSLPKLLSQLSRFSLAPTGRALAPGRKAAPS